MTFTPKTISIAIPGGVHLSMPDGLRSFAVLRQFVPQSIAFRDMQHETLLERPEQHYSSAYVAAARIKPCDQFPLSGEMIRSELDSALGFF